VFSPFNNGIISWFTLRKNKCNDLYLTGDSLMLLEKAKLNETNSWDMSAVCSALYAIKRRNFPALLAPNNLYGKAGEVQGYPVNVK
jgi:hypothetical protein